MTTAILALDQGTTSSRSMLFDPNGRPLDAASAAHHQHYPQPGWVEHDPEEILAAQLATARTVIDRQAGRYDIAAVGIANQRETTVVWDRRTGKPVHPAIVWQDRRTAPFCDELKQAGWELIFRERTGLVIDPYFSATKIRWLLDNVSGLRQSAERGVLAFGTIDSYLIYQLTGGERHVTDVSNAARTMLFNIHTLDWDDDILRELAIPRAMLPEICSSSEIIGTTKRQTIGIEVPIAGVAGDQQAASFGQACFATGRSKQTYGTGSFLLMNTGQQVVASTHGLISTVAWRIDDVTTYALEGSAFVAGAAIQWLRDGIGMIADAGETAALAASVTTSGGVYFVPAFVGLGAPYWDPDARGALLGLTRGSGKAEIARAVLESIALQTRDLVLAMEADSGIAIEHLCADGGMAVNDIFMQIQADVLGRAVRRPSVTETTALGAALLAGLAVGLWRDVEELERLWSLEREFTPRQGDDERERLYRGWQRAVERSRNWATADD